MYLRNVVYINTCIVLFVDFRNLDEITTNYPFIKTVQLEVQHLCNLNIDMSRYNKTNLRH